MRGLATRARQWVAQVDARPSCNLYSCVFVLAMVGVLMTAARARATSRNHEDEAQRTVDALRGLLGIEAPVSVSMVEHDPRALSVRADAETPGTFALRIDRAFAATLTAEQLQAALAHELGHVWIATHHPYLQTEQLANRVAMRAVPRERLVEVYTVLWGQDAVHGDLATFLGMDQ